MKIIVIQSGSKGNATLVIDEGRVILIDMGISLTCLKNALEKENLNTMNINAMLLTHEHYDHTAGIKYLNPLPIYCTRETYDAINIIPIVPYEWFEIEHFKILPVSTSHDVKNPLGFVIKTAKEKLVYITDTGKIPSKTLSKLKNADYYVFESNHDVEMLLDTKRPPYLKKRILSNTGHLSNVQSANYLVKLIGDKTKEIILAHLSQEANTPKLALKTHKDIYKQFNVSLKNIKIKCASQCDEVRGGCL